MANRRGGAGLHERGGAERRVSPEGTGRQHGGGEGGWAGKAKQEEGGGEKGFPPPPEYSYLKQDGRRFPVAGATGLDPLHWQLVSEAAHAAGQRENCQAQERAAV